MNNDQDDIDLSSFPLLRIDELPRHTTNTLIEAESQLIELQQGWYSDNADNDRGAISSIAPFVSKLLGQLRKEISERETASHRANNVQTQNNKSPVDRGTPQKSAGGATVKQDSSLSTPTRSKPSSRQSGKQNDDTLLPSKVLSSRKQQSSKRRPLPKKSSSNVSFFVTNSPSSKSSNFLARAKQAKAFLQSRNDIETISRHHSQRRQERTRQALRTMQEWRLERERSKYRRQELLEEERRIRRQRRKEREERAQKVQDSMQVAAEEAKMLALHSGCTREEANMEAAAAAAAAAKAVDDDSTIFHKSAGDLDDSSIETCDAGDEGGINNNSNQILDGECREVTEISITTIGNDVANMIGESEVEMSLTNANSTKAALPKESLDCNQLCLDKMVCASVVPRDDAESTKGSDSLNTDNTDNNDDGIMKGLCHRGEDVRCNNLNPLKEQHAEALDGTPKLSTEGYSKNLTPSCVTGELEREDGKWGADAATPHHYSNSASLVASTSNNNTNSDVGKSDTKDRPHNFGHDKETVDNLDAKIKTSLAGQREISGGRKFREQFPTFSDIFSEFQSKVNQGGRRSTSTSSDAVHRELSKCMEIQVQRHSFFVDNLRDVSGSDSDDSSSDEPNCCARFYSIKSRRPEVTSIIRKGFSERLLSSWEKVPQDLEDSNPFWNLQWTWGLPKASDFEHLLVFQKISRFRGTKGLTRKDLLKKNIQRFGSTLCTRSSDSDTTDPFNIMPLTYALPHEYNAFVDAYSSIRKIGGGKTSNYWIIKPVGLSRGRGISVVSSIDEVSYSQPIVIQRYVSDPFLFLGYKFDLRIYVLVTSFSPLEAFIYKEGLARFGSRPYSSKPESLHDNRIHLTNSSIQKEFGDSTDRSHPAYLAGPNGAESKAAMSWLWKRFDESGVDTNALWCKITDVCLKALVTTGSEIPYQPNSFEVFGFDVMFDNQLKCWLIEVNSSPSLSCDSMLDTRIKGGLIRDTIALVDPPVFDRKALADVCKRRQSQRKTASNVLSGDVLEEDLSNILGGKVPRSYGEMPRRMGNFERISPGSSFDEMRNQRKKD